MRKIVNKSRILIFSITSAFLFILLTIHPFLAHNERLKAELLVVEGWIDDQALKKANDEFNHGRYMYLVIVGGPLPKSLQSKRGNSLAERAAKTLISYGFKKKYLIVLSSPPVKHHNTYSFAITLRNWLMNSSYKITAINVFTEGVHARKSFIIYKNALGPGIKVGIISSGPFDYNPYLWFFSVEGIKWVIKDGIGYIYALIWFS